MMEHVSHVGFSSNDKAQPNFSLLRSTLSDWSVQCGLVPPLALPTREKVGTNSLQENVGVECHCRRSLKLILRQDS